MNTSNKITKKTISSEMIKRIIYSFVYGDVLGVPMEFSNEYSKICVDKYVAPNHYKQPTGVWSDDTALMLATIDSLSQPKGIDFKDLMNRYYQYIKGKYTSTNKAFDIGIGTQKALIKYRLGYKPLNAGGKHNRNNGNGAIMRLLPILFLPEIKNPDSDLLTRFNIIKNYTKVTHGHYTAIIGTFIYIELLRELLINGHILTLEATTVNQILNYIENEIMDLSQIVDEKESKQIIKAQSQYADLFDNSVVTKTYKGSGYVVDTLCFAIKTIMTHNDFKSAVVYAANNAKDNDTVAAITGAIGSLYYTNDNYNPPVEWYDEILNRQIIEDYLETFIITIKGDNI